MIYALFEEQEIAEGGAYGFFMMPKLEGEDWKPKKKGWYFIKLVKNPKELSKVIREEFDIDSRFAVLAGEFHEIKTMQTFFMQGKNLNTMEAEWS